MLHPSFLELREKIVGESEENDLNRYSLIIGTAKRARQIIEEEKYLARKAELEGDQRISKTVKPKPVSRAVKEIYDDQVHILEEDVNELY